MRQPRLATCVCLGAEVEGDWDHVHGGFVHRIGAVRFPGDRRLDGDSIGCGLSKLQQRDPRLGRGVALFGPKKRSPETPNRRAQDR